MFCQLGNIQFTGLFSPTTFTTEGDEATYAVHELIGSKPRLQKTGDELQKLTFEIKLRADFCNPTNSLATMKAAKEAGTIMPLLLGNGKYVNDYVIISMPYEIIEAFDDGTIVEAKVTLTIWEYISVNKQQQAMLSARQAAFAVGVTDPVVTRPPQLPAPEKQIAQTVTAITQQSSIIDKLVSDFQNASAGADVIGNKILAACKKVDAASQSVNTQLDNARAIDNQFNLIRSGVNSVRASGQAMANLHPFTSVSQLTQANLLLQSDNGVMKTNTSGLLQLVAVRQPPA